MDLWVAITLGAAFSQTLRTALERRLANTELMAIEAASVRFCFAVPFAWLYVAYLGINDFDFPNINYAFLGYVFSGALPQIFGTFFLLRAFETRNFTVGTAYSKTETMQIVVFGLLLLGETITWSAFVGILVSFFGVLLLSSRQGWRQILSQGPGLAGWFGIATGACFGLAAVCYRAASLSLPEGEFFVRAAMTVAAATTIQMIVMVLYLGLWGPKLCGEKNSIIRVARTWRSSVWVGLAGMIASTGWFTAMTIEKAALVRALGQIELLFTLLFTIFLFRERISGIELTGSAFIVFGLLVLVLN